MPRIKISKILQKISAFKIEDIKYINYIALSLSAIFTAFFVFYVAATISPLMLKMSLFLALTGMLTLLLFYLLYFTGKKLIHHFLMTHPIPLLSYYVKPDWNLFTCIGISSLIISPLILLVSSSFLYMNFWKWENIFFLPFIISLLFFIWSYFMPIIGLIGDILANTHYRIAFFAKRHLLTVLFFTCLIFIPNSAFAFNTNEIITYGYADVTAGVIGGAAAIANSGAFQSVLAVIVAFALSYLIIVTGISEKDWKKVIYGFFYVTLVYGGLIQVKVNVTVINQAPPYNSVTVNNVPWGLGFTASAISNTGDIITQKFEQYFSLPNSFAYSQAGLIHPIRLFDALPTVSPSSQYLIKNVENYFIDCAIAIDYSEGIYSWDDLWGATDIWTALAPGANGPFPVSIFTLSGGVWTPGETTCDAAYTTINSQYQADYGNQVKQSFSHLGITSTAQFEADFDEANTYYGAISQSAADSVKNAAFMHSLDQAFDYADIQSGGNPGMYALTLTQAEISQRYQQKIGGIFSAQNVPIMRGIFEVFMYGGFALLFFFIIIPSVGWKYFVSYLTFLVWLAMWGPLFTIINYMLAYSAKSELAAAGYNVLTSSNCGACMIGLTGMSSIAGKWTGIVESYIGLVPMMSLVLLTAGATYGFVQLAGATKGASDSAASGAGEGMKSGEIRMGNVSMNKADTMKVVNQGYSESTVGKSESGLRVTSGNKVDIANDFRNGNYTKKQGERDENRDGVSVQSQIITTPSGSIETWGENGINYTELKGSDGKLINLQAESTKQDINTDADGNKQGWKILDNEKLGNIDHFSGKVTYSGKGFATAEGINKDTNMQVTGSYDTEKGEWAYQDAKQGQTEAVLDRKEDQNFTNDYGKLHFTGAHKTTVGDNVHIEGRLLKGSDDMNKAIAFAKDEGHTKVFEGLTKLNNDLKAGESVKLDLYGDKNGNVATMRYGHGEELYHYDTSKKDFTSTEEYGKKVQSFNVNQKVIGLGTVMSGIGQGVFENNPTVASTVSDPHMNPSRFNGEVFTLTTSVAKDLSNYVSVTSQELAKSGNSQYVALGAKVFGVGAGHENNWASEEGKTKMHNAIASDVNNIIRDGSDFAKKHGYDFQKTSEHITGKLNEYAKGVEAQMKQGVAVTTPPGEGPNRQTDEEKEQHKATHYMGKSGSIDKAINENVFTSPKKTS